MNTFGQHFSFLSFGESHGKAIGGVLDGVPAGITISITDIYNALSVRAGRNTSWAGTSARANMEEDQVEWLSGVMEHDGILISLGSPIAFLIHNKQARSADYDMLRFSFRPGHADWVYQQKYGLRDTRGGGRSSARETAARVVAGEIARTLLTKQGIHISAHLAQVGKEIEEQKMQELLQEIKRNGDSIGGIVSCCVTGVPVGVGEPVYDKLESHLAAAMLSIPACHGFDYGSGFADIDKRGSELYLPNEVPCYASGGIEGGIANGLPIRFRCMFKPTASIMRLYGGRHDVCVAIRAVAVVEAMTALVLQDLLSGHR